LVTGSANLDKEGANWHTETGQIAPCLLAIKVKRHCEIASSVTLSLWSQDK
jgi:hypothetical protein